MPTVRPFSQSSTRPADDPDGALVGVTLFEERASGRHLLDGDLLGERVQVLPLHSFERGKGAQQFYADFAGIR